MWQKFWFVSLVDFPSLILDGIWFCNDKTEKIAPIISKWEPLLDTYSFSVSLNYRISSQVYCSIYSGKELLENIFWQIKSSSDRCDTRIRKMRKKSFFFKQRSRFLTAVIKENILLFGHFKGEKALRHEFKFFILTYNRIINEINLQRHSSLVTLQ